MKSEKSYTLSEKFLYRKEFKFKTIIYLNVFNMNQTKGNKRSRFFALLLAGVLSVASLSAQAQNRTIKGCITDANNKEPLMGATITLDGGKTGAVKVNFNTTNSMQTRAQMVEMNN